MRRGTSTSKPASLVRSNLLRRFGALAIAAFGIVGARNTAAAQGGTGVITGTVTEAGTHSPLVSANIRVTGSQVGAQSAADGKFTVRGVTPGASVEISVTRIGYEAKKQTVRVTAGQTATVTIELSQAPFSLATVVTTVTGVQSKAEISNTVAQIDVSAKINEAPITTTGELLSGRASGVQVVSSGATGSGSRIRVRGQSSLSLSNDPIVYVDGVRVDGSSGAGLGTGGTTTSALDNIAPEEIETIDVIKGPAAATLYGTAAANGVIVITTKKGRAGATRYQAFSENGTLYDPHKGNYPDLIVSFDRRTGLKTCSLLQEAAGSCVIDSTFRGNILNDPTTTPLANGNRAQYGLQISGGTDKLQYFVSGDQEHEQGPYKMPDIEINRLMAERGSTIGDDQIFPNALKRVNMRTNLNAQLSPKVNFSVSVGYVDSDIRQPQNEDNSDGLMVDAVGGSARTDLKDARGIPLLGYRSFPMGDIFAQVTSTNVNRYIGSASGQYLPFSWLTTRANVGFDYSARNSNFLQQFGQGPFGETNRTGDAQSQRSENDIYTIDVGGTANFTPRPKFGVKTSGGIQYFRNYNSSTSATGQTLPPGAVTPNAGLIKTATQATSESINLGAYGEEVLSYSDRIFLTGGLRYDGNSAFGSSFSGVYYPKLGLSWLLSDESFFPKIEAINSFRARATYGSSGVQPGPTNAARFYSTANANVAGVEQTGVTLGALGNSHLKPEYSGEFEGGFDMTLFQSRTSIELTYYNKKTKDALISAPTPPSVGGSIGSILENIGSTQNQGEELTLNQKLIDRNNIGFEFQLTASANKNKIVTLGQGITPISTGNRSTQYNAPGYPLFGLWGRTYTYADANNNGIIEANELKYSDTAVFIGPSFPTHEFALSPRLELLHRKLAISAQFDHKDGMTKFYNTLRHRCQGGNSCPGLWDPTASLKDQAAAVADNGTQSIYTGMFYNGEFTRFRELSVSYQLPDALAAKIHSSRASLIGTGRNLHVWTAYPGIDPEATVGNADQRGNEEYFSTPPLRYFTVRLNLAF